MNTPLTIGDYMAWRRKAVLDKLIRLRQTHGLSQQDLADLLGCSRARIARIETGRGEYTLSELEVLALRFGADPLHFLSSTASERAWLNSAYAQAVSAPALGQVIPCAHPAGGAVKKPIDLLAWSPDSRFLAAPVRQRGADDAVILCIWEAASGKLETALHLDDEVSALAFSPEGRLLAVAGSMDTVEVWDWRRQTVVAGLDPVDSGIYTEDGMWEFVHAAGYGLITQVEFSPDGKILAARNEDHGTIRLWSAENWTKLRTLSVHAMRAEVELEQTRLRLGREWQIERNEAEERFLYGSWSEPFLFSPDSRCLALLDRVSKELDFFTLEGHYAWGMGFVRQPEAVDMVGLNQDGSMALIAAGGEGHLFEVWQQQGPYERGFLYTNSEEPPLAESTIKQIRIVNPDCVLGLVVIGTAIGNRRWFVVNLVSNQPLPLPDLEATLIIGDNDVKLAPDGRAVAYQDTRRQLRIQPLRLEYLTARDKNASLKIEITRPPQDVRSQWRALFDEARAQAEIQEDLAQVEVETAERSGGPLPALVDFYPPPEPGRERTPVDEVILWLLRVISLRRPLLPERFGLAYLPPADTDAVHTLVDLIKQRFSKEGQVRLVELPPDGPRVDERMLLEYIAERRLDQAETSQEVIAALEGCADIIIIDRAERLHHDTMIAICDELQDLPAQTFLLIVRDEAAFLQEADKIRAGSRWLLDRAVANHSLARLSQPGAVELDQAEDAGSRVYAAWSQPRGQALPAPEGLSRLEFNLYRLKTATPAAQGGYGLAFLPRYDRTTVRTLMDMVNRQTSDRIVLVELATSGPRARLRQIVQGVVGRPLARGELTDTVLHQEVWRKYNLIVIDNAERLHPDTLGWICSHLRDIADAFLLVVRDREVFEQEVIGQTGSPAWTYGRAVSVDLIEWLG